MNESMPTPSGLHTAAESEQAKASIPFTEAQHPEAAAVPSAAHLAAYGVVKSYRKGATAVPVLRGVNLSADRGEFVSIVGQSGSGKSTLLHILGSLDQPDEGQVYFQGYRIDDLLPAGRDLLRNKYFGMIFQFYHLLPELTTLENVLAPAMIESSLFRYLSRRRELIDDARRLLNLVGLDHRLRHKPRELSGGEMQRTAIARALMLRPEVLLADEPTGNLDRASGVQILELLQRLNIEENLTIVMVTHDHAVARQAHRTIRLEEGSVHQEEVTASFEYPRARA